MSGIKNPEIKYTQAFINNEWVDSLSERTFKSINPCTEEKICDVQDCGKEDVDAAVKAARKAFELGSEWRTMDASQRGRIINKFAQLIRRDSLYLGSLESLDHGKPFKDSYGEVYWAASVMEYYSGWADKIQGKTVPVDGEYTSFTRHEPVGVCGQILPWTYPLPMLAMKLGPALACGNTVVVKPSKQTSLTALYCCSLLKEAGFPPGVVNIVPGAGAVVGLALTEHMDIDMLAFTGSTKVGQSIVVAAAKSNMKKVTTELGGKSPMVVFEDSDVDRAVKLASTRGMICAGQRCCAPTRVYVQESIYDEFVRRSKVMAENRVLGNPFDSRVDQGPQTDPGQYRKVLEYIEIGKKEGAILQCGGGRHGDKGFFIKPTIFSDVQDNMRIAREELFGPVQCIFKFKTLEEVIDRSNDSDLGLAAGIFTSDINKIMTYIQSVQSGNIWVNCYDESISAQTTFGGYKLSGEGRELGEDGLASYYEIKTVTIRLDEKNS